MPIIKNCFDSHAWATADNNNTRRLKLKQNFPIRGIGMHLDFTISAASALAFAQCAPESILKRLSFDWNGITVMNLSGPEAWLKALVMHGMMPYKRVDGESATAATPNCGFFIDFGQELALPVSPSDAWLSMELGDVNSLCGAGATLAITAGGAVAAATPRTGSWIDTTLLQQTEPNSSGMMRKIISKVVPLGQVGDMEIELSTSEALNDLLLIAWDANTGSTFTKDATDQNIHWVNVKFELKDQNDLILVHSPWKSLHRLGMVPAGIGQMRGANGGTVASMLQDDWDMQTRGIAYWDFTPGLSGAVDPKQIKRAVITVTNCLNTGLLSVIQDTIVPLPK